MPRNHEYIPLEKTDKDDVNNSQDANILDESQDYHGIDALEPTEVELKTLRRVSSKIPWTAYSLAFVELCERFSWYGTTAVFVNFIQHPLPPDSTTGASGTYGQAGALGQGQRMSTSLTTFNSFWSYTMPLIGAYVADQYFGRLKTIQYAIRFALLGHCILIVSALPFMIARPNLALGVFTCGLIVMGGGTGGFKSNISPLLAEQITVNKKVIKVLPSGERVIVDPVVTVSRLFMYFYLIINVGSLTGGISMVYAEKYIGFWCAFALPTVMFLLCPIVLASCSDRYHQTVPGGSVLGSALRLYILAWRQRLSGSSNKADFWDAVKPSNVKQQSSWMTFSDSWVDQVARGFSACKVFAWFPLYWLAYNQMVNNLTSQSATLDLGRVPNDIVNNLNPLCLIIVIPLMDNLVYPLLRQLRINFTPIKRITFGFFVASLAISSAAITQSYIYSLSACKSSASTCDTPTPISVWVQTIPYVLIGMSEVFASVTGLEYAFTKAPENMRSLVTGVFLLQTALSSILGQVLVPLSADPYLVLNYSIVAFLAAAGGFGFWFSHRELDKREDELNMLNVQAEYM